MKMELTKEAMMALWKRRHFIEPLRADCLISRSDGVDTDARVAEEMRAWYLELLRTGPLTALSPVDMSLTAKVTAGNGGCAEIRLAPNVVRVAAVKLEGWERAIEPWGVLPEAARRRQGNKYACGGVACPMAEFGAEHVLRLWCPSTNVKLPAVEALDVIVDTGADHYVFDESAVALINPSGCMA